MKTQRLALVALASGISVVAFAQTPGSSFLGTRWNRVGPNNAVKAPPFGNGESTWSIVAPNIGLQNGVPDNDHPANDLTLNFNALLGPNPVRTPEQIFLSALKVWQTGSNSAWRLVVNGQDGKVADGGGLIGGPNQAMSGVGDMRVGVLHWKDRAPSTQPAFDVIAHAFRPDTLALNDIAGFGSIGGDIHFRPSLAQDPQNGVDWVDNPLAIVGVDLETVMIHEIGHALGLDHNMGDPMSVMQPVYAGPRRILSGTDVQNITQLYTPVPEPASFAALALGALAVLRRRRTAG